MTRTKFLNELAKIELEADSQLTPSESFVLRDYTELVAKTCQPGAFDNALAIARGYIAGVTRDR